MNLPPLPLIDGRLYVDNSGWMEGTSSCYRYLQYKCLNLRVPAAEKPSLNFGSGGHLAKELRYLRYGSGAVDDHYFEELTPILTEFYAKHPLPQDDWRDLNWAMKIERKYCERYLAEDFKMLAYENPVKCPMCNGAGTEIFDEGAPFACRWCNGSGKRDKMVEMTFALHLFTYEWGNDAYSALLGRGIQLPRQIPVVYTGRIDLAVMLDGGIWVMDHKHVGQLGDMFWNEQRMSAQQRGYVWAFKEVTQQPVRGYIVNAIRTKEPPKYVTEGKPYRSSTSTPEKWWGESFARERFLCDQWKIDEWKRNTIDLIEEFFWHYQRGFMPQKTKWCSMYGKCPYLDICTVMPEDRGALLQSGAFADNTWSPMKQPTQPMQ